MFEPWPGEKERLMALPGRRRCGPGRLFLFRNLLWTKGTMGQTTNIEVSKFWKFLMKRTKRNDLCKVPACSAVGPHLERCAFHASEVRFLVRTRGLLVSCVVRWLIDPYEKQGQRFKPIPYMQQKSKPKIWSLKALFIYIAFQIPIFDYFCWLCSLHPFIFQILVDSPTWRFFVGGNTACLEILGGQLCQNKCRGHMAACSC
jgi:hypothetical protein